MDLIIDEYINNFNLFPLGKNSFECEIGSLTFLKDETNNIIIYEIFVKQEKRRKGHCRNLIIHSINKCKEFKCKLLIISVISKPLYKFLKEFKNEEGRFMLKTIGFEFCFFKKKK